MSNDGGPNDFLTTIISSAVSLQSSQLGASFSDFRRFYPTFGGTSIQSKGST